MVINYFKMPIYGIFIILSIILGNIFHFIYLNKEGINHYKILLSILMTNTFCIICAKILTLLTTNNSALNLFSAGLTSYGGAIGIIIASIIFSKLSDNKYFVKSNILGLPLMYSISKLGCFFAGCCSGIPYDGIFSVTYISGLNISLFPVQLVESILFMLIFIIGILFRKNEYIIELLLISCALGKFLLDYLRYSHLDKVISMNQIISLFIIVICLLLFLKHYVYKKNAIS